MMYNTLMFRLFLVLGFSCLFLALVSCENDEKAEITPLISNTFQNLSATQSTDYSVNPPSISGDYIKFSFAEGEVVTGNNWDIAFRGTTILVNGGQSTSSDQPDRTGSAGAYITSGTLESVASVNESMIQQDTENQLAILTGSGNGWYNYSPETHLITPIAGKVLVIRTHDNRYAKVEILSYYKDAPSEPTGENSQHYTFNYIYQPNENSTEF